MARDVRLWKLQGWDKTLIYQGPIEEAPEPARSFWKEAVDLYGEEEAWNFFGHIAPPMGLISIGYVLEPLEFALLWEEAVKKAEANRRRKSN